MESKKLETRTLHNFTNIAFSNNLSKRIKGTCSSLTFEIFNQLYKHNLGRFKDIHKGERCFILGNGPSIIKQNLAFISNEVSFVTNSFILHKDFREIAPNYYCISDYLALRESESHLLRRIEEYVNFEGIGSLLFVPDRFWFNLRFRSIFKSNVFYLNFKNNKKIWEDGNFSIDIQKGVNYGHTVIIDFCLPIAFYMGFDKIYLLGCDMDISNDKSDNHFYKETDPSHWRRDDIVREQWYKMVSRSYEVAKKIFADNNRIIYNATQGGKLEVFPRVDFENLFSPRF